MLFDYCHLFASTPEQWDIRHPGKAFALDFRARLRRGFGAIFAASDRARPRAADRLGVSLRRYEMGDSLRAVALRHFLRTNELLTRTDFAPGRQNGLTILHTYQNMAFSSPKTAGNKGQVALCAAGIVECVHQSLGQMCELIAVRERDLPAKLSTFRKQIKRSDFIYIFTDLLFNPNSLDASGQELVSGLAQAGVRRAAIFVVRDPYELPTDNPLLEKTTTLKDFAAEVRNPINGDGENPTNNLFSGEDYATNIVVQLNNFTRLGANHSLNLHVVSGRTSIEAVAQAIAANIGSKVR